MMRSQSSNRDKNGDMEQPRKNNTKQDDKGDDDGSMSSIVLHSEDDETNRVHTNTDPSLSGSRNYLLDDGSNHHIKPDFAAKETKHIQMWRTVLVAVLVLFALAVCTGTYWFVMNETNEEYKLSFGLFANSIEAQLGHHVENIEESMRNLGDTISASSDQDQSPPFIVLPKFEVHGEHARARSRMEAITYAPLVTSEQIPAWQFFSVDNQDWIAESRSTYLEYLNAGREPPVYLPGKVSPFIYKLQNDIFPEQVKENVDGNHTTYAPIWYLSPPPFNPAIVNFDLLSHQAYQALIQEAIARKEPAFSSIVDVERFLSLQVSDTDHLKYHKQYIDVAAGTGYDRPHTTYVRPVFMHRKSDVVSGVLLGIMAWDVYLAELVPEGVNGMIAVIHSTCGENSTYTYELNGAKPTFLGQGDLHDRSFNDMERHIGFFATDKNSLPWLEKSRNSRPDGDSCNYWVSIYPSDTFKEAYKSNIAIIATLTVGATFLIVALCFFVYDILINKRNAKITAVAEKSNAVVNSLFPAEVRDRLLENKIDVTPSTFLKQNTKYDNAETGKSRAIADHFPDVTILFCDIVGFTAWSSMREPHQVFELLEALYCQFDLIARRRLVFKVETIGDCYVAACGLPKPNKDHAVVMTRFARDCLATFIKLVKNLEVSLGPDTGDLGVRIGLHSGPVTAGVLRGDRARFQLFGDSMNVAARIESNGSKNRIHISEDTATLLIQAGKESWLLAREDKIHAKGKGHLQTYWVEFKSEKASSSKDSHHGSGHNGSDGDLSIVNEAPEVDTNVEDTKEVARRQELDSKTQRLIQWNVELLEKLIKKVVARHAAIYGNAIDIAMVESIVYTSKGKPSDEVVEIIALPEFDTKLEDQQLENDVKVPDGVIDELLALVSGIAAMYNDNDFHSFEHASHVTMSVSKLLSRIVAPYDGLGTDDEGKEGNLAALHDHTYGITSDPLTQFACILSALIHDVDHQGVSNMQLVKENAPVAVAYGTSPAEQNSIDVAFSLIMGEQFKSLRKTLCPTQKEFERFRQLIVNSVMATDIMDKDLKALRNARWEKAFNGSGKNEDPRDTVNRKATIVIEHLIQASDVAHTMQHWHIYRKWNERFFMECYKAYKAGRGGDVNPAENWYNGELGFFDFYIIPLAKKLKDCGVFGVSSDEYLKYACSNRQEWANRGQEVVASMVAKAQKRLEREGLEKTSDIQS